jgi:hypothetical protein
VDGFKKGDRVLVVTGAMLSINVRLKSEFTGRVGAISSTRAQVIPDEGELIEDEEGVVHGGLDPLVVLVADLRRTP